MGRNRKPSEDLDRRGAFDHDPVRGRERANEPDPKGVLGPPPEDFIEAERTRPALLKAWRDLEAATAAVRLTSADRLHFEATARLLARTRGYQAKVSDFTALTQALGKFGLNPADRSKVVGHGKKTEEDESQEWDEFESEGAVVSVQ